MKWTITLYQRGDKRQSKMVYRVSSISPRELTAREVAKMVD